MSSDLTWLIIRDNNSFLVKRNGAQFSKEANNLTNLNSFKYSGLANNKTVGVTAGDKNAVVLATKKTVAVNQPGKNVASQKLARDFRRTAKSIKNVVANYRPDLTQAALARLTAVKESGKVKKAVAKKVRGSRK